MPIRLFTSGSHTTKGGTFSFSNEDIDRILGDTQKSGKDPLPIVLGHPENNLPIVGFLPVSAIKRYTEGDKVSLGFERGSEEISKESMDIIRDLKSNKISVSVRDGVIRHIGLVQKAAVEENNTQNFAAGTLTGEFSAGDEITEHQPNDFQKFFQDFKNEIKTIFKPNNMAEEKKPDTQQQTVDMSAIKTLTETVATLAGVVNGLVKKEKANADFSAPEYKDLSQTQKDTAATIMADLGSEESKTALKGLLKELAKPAVKVENGSKVKDFGAPAKETRTAEEIVRDQLNALNA